jgi:hypothetical protein
MFELGLSAVACVSSPSDGRWHLVVTDCDGRPYAYTWVARGAFFVYVVGIAVYRFAGATRAVAVRPEPHVDSEDILHAYHSTALPLGAQAKLVYEAVHASGVLTSAGVVVLCGASEVGKSTTAYGLSRRGYALWADDAVVFDAEQQGAVASTSLPFTLSLRPRSERYFGQGSSVESIQGPAEGRREPIAAVFLLERCSSRSLEGRAVQTDRMTPAAALVALLENAYRFLPRRPERERRMMQTYLELAAHVPVVRTRFVPGLNGLDELLDGIEASLLTVSQDVAA